MLVKHLIELIYSFHLKSYMLKSLIFIFLIVLYKEQNIRVRKNSTFSELFSVSNGVKQCGVLSPILFSLYLDKLLVELRELGIAWHRLSYERFVHWLFYLCRRYHYYCSILLCFELNVECL